MKKNIKNYTYINLKIFLITLNVLFIIVGCSDFEDKNLIDQSANLSNDSIKEITITDGTLKINSKAYLKSIIASYQKDVTGQNNFNKNIRELQKNGFKPLTPILDVNDKEQIEAFILRKKAKIQKTNKSLGINVKTTEEEIDTDDNLIADPALGALLNEDREIIVADSLYKYTETGMYFCLIKDKQKLYNYLNSLTITQKRSTITNRVAPCNQEALKQTAKIAIIDPVTEVIDGINRFLPEPVCNTSPNSPSQPVAVLPPSPSPRLIKQNLPITTIEKQGFFEQIFGERESDIQDFGDGHRVKVTFWNQNFYLFSSIGCSARFQKRKKFLGVAWWEKSYADQIELGVNNIQYDYKFNVPQFNQAQYEYSTVFFESKGMRFNINGKPIYKMPTDNPGFIFDTDNPDDFLNITICNRDFLYLSAQDANKAIDFLAKSAVAALPGSYDKYILQNKIANDKLKYNVMIASPLDNKVTMKSMNIMWTYNNDNAITHYFDFNYLFKWKSSYSDFGDYLQGLIGGTSYSNVSIDMYGAAFHNNQWKGIRLLSDIKK